MIKSPYEELETDDIVMVTSWTEYSKALRTKPENVNLVLAAEVFEGKELQRQYYVVVERTDDRPYAQLMDEVVEYVQQENRFDNIKKASDHVTGPGNDEEAKE